jgi:hypothetical protein
LAALPLWPLAALQRLSWLLLLVPLHLLLLLLLLLVPKLYHFPWAHPQAAVQQAVAFLPALHAPWAVPSLPPALHLLLFARRSAAAAASAAAVAAGPLACSD